MMLAQTLTPLQIYLTYTHKEGKRGKSTISREERESLLLFKA